MHLSSNFNSCPERLCKGIGRTLRKDDSCQSLWSSTWIIYLWGCKQLISINTAAAAWGTELIQFIATQAILHQENFKKGMNRSWLLGEVDALLCKKDNHPVHTSETNTFPKWMFSQILFFESSLLLKWLVRHWSRSPNQQRRPLPSILYISLFHDASVLKIWPDYSTATPRAGASSGSSLTHRYSIEQ